ncbi:MAG: MBL fold metallo-hydrolase [Rhodospirillaceae bacterium]|jgi:ribonuclease Z|nr:MBL fold metallo-hydrolase [Rhodospirillaceae bacterium]MBT4940446.1 MBL fold metallo-hydrolase [Rhodospirillaceae bacterium]MBT5941480.1 MBL fold metallo-hydrolase [Rhodospirillaceae bacterium]MBT7957200.1 MBL fold metallo-hydrolase [Rhodospirillaceae bacterium]
MALEITLLGTGLPFPNPKRAGPGYMVQAGDTKILVECGSGVVRRLVEAGHSPGDIHHLFLSHLHSDHFIDLGHFLISRWILGDDRPLHVFGAEGLQRMINLILEILEPDLRMRMSIRKVAREMPNVVVHHISEGQALDEDGFKVSAFDVEHFPLEQPFGYRFDIKDHSIVFSGDTRPCDNLIKHASGVDLLVHECTEANTWSKEHGSGQIDTHHIELAHTQPEQLGLIGRDAGVKELVVTHMNPQTIPENIHSTISRDFDGPLTIGEDLMKF